MNRGSGTWQGQRRISGGRTAVREALYMSECVVVSGRPRDHASVNQIAGNVEGMSDVLYPFLGI